MKTSIDPSSVSVASPSGTALSDEDRKFLCDEFNRIHDIMEPERARVNEMTEEDHDIADATLGLCEFAFFRSLLRIRRRFNIPYDWPSPPADAGPAPEGIHNPDLNQTHPPGTFSGADDV